RWPPARRPGPGCRAGGSGEAAGRAGGSSRNFLTLLLFEAELAAQQLARVVGDLAQPLFQGLAPFAVQRRQVIGARRAILGTRRGGIDRRFLGRLVRRGGVALFRRRGGRGDVVRSRAGRLFGIRSRLCGDRLFGRRLPFGFPLAQQRLDQLAIVAGLLQLRIALQSQVVGPQGLFQLACLRQGVAAIVVVGRRVAGGEALGGLGVFPGQVEGVALAAGIAEQTGRPREVAFLQQALGPLLVAQPQAVV